MCVCVCVRAQAYSVCVCVCVWLLALIAITRYSVGVWGWGRVTRCVLQFINGFGSEVEVGSKCALIDFGTNYWGRGEGRGV